MRANAVILFVGDSRRDETRKGLPPRFLMHLHSRIASTIRSFHEVDLLVIRQTGPLGIVVDRAITETFDRGYQRVVLVAGDIAGLTREHLQRAIASDAAIGRSPDGGFYLLALSRRLAIDWNSIRWCTRHAFDDVVAALGAHDALPELDDIDSLPDALRVLRAPQFAVLYCRLRSLLRGSRFAARGSRIPTRAAYRLVPLRAPPLAA